MGPNIPAEARARTKKPGADLTKGGPSLKVNSMTPTEFYQTHLDRVSRSFAFCIRQLPSPLREWVGLSYLLCRLVDTVEDANWSNHALQGAEFARFDAALADPARDLVDWAKQFPADIPESERLLLVDADRLMHDYHAFPAPVREAMRTLIGSMSRGMQHFSAPGELRLRDVREVNQYCFFVAGVVGELLTHLLAAFDAHFKITPLVLRRAHHFGQFLQKVNLLKDQVGDEREGRHLVPSRADLERVAFVNAQNALEFLVALPARQTEFRRFCAWSLFLGLEALAVARRSLNENRVLKVQRRKMEEILGAVEEALGDEGALRQLFARGTDGWSGEVVATAGPPAWFLPLYPGVLDQDALAELGV